MKAGGGTGTDTHGRPSAAYPPIGALGMIGDGHSVALLGPDASVEWFCPGRFDADPLVWPLLDRTRGGALRVGPTQPAQTSVRYAGETAVLEYDWQGEQGRALCQVGLRWPIEKGWQQLIWVIRGLEGALEITLDCQPRPAFGREQPRLLEDGEAVIIATEAQQLVLTATAPLQIEEDGVHARLRLRANEVVIICLAVPLAAAEGEPPTAQAAMPALEQTAQAWRRWAVTIVWEGAYRDSVVRSAITLKQLIYEPSGAVVAAPTSSLPEAIGGERNWDYRYTWFRDASFTLNALYSLGCRREAHRWAKWMLETLKRHGLPLRVLYRVDGSTDLSESEVPGVEGYRGSKPVRIGNGAEAQFQLDIYGELLDCLTLCEIMGDQAMREYWPQLRELANFTCDHWREADSGIWEVRDQPRHFVYSKAMAWVGLDRALRLQRELKTDGEVERWRQEAQALREQILDKGVAPQGYFTRAYGEAAMDASLLLLAVSGFIEGDDPRALRTLEAVREQLTPGHSRVPGLLLRYPHDTGDGLPGGEGAFALCSFWLVEALALAGRRAEAEALFEHLLSLQGPLGLYAEEIDSQSGAQLGNFPQAFTHIGLINAALRLRRRSAKGHADAKAHAAPAGDQGGS